MLQFASLSFDASVSEIFTTLVAGATLVLAQRDTLMSPATLLALLRDMAITTVTLPPSLLAMMPSENLPALETVVSAGESCSWEVALRWSEGRRFLNAYGPTEATVGPTAHVVEGRVPGTRSVPIGRPLPNMQVYILDQHQQPLPVGVPGEVYIAGVGLARGYLNRPELTAQKFVEVAFDLADRMATADDTHIARTVAASQHVRLYRTGDLARFLPDGAIEFLGRVDHQVKLRGLRVELGEIESLLRQHPSVQDAVVTVREDSPGDQRLVGYVTPQTAQSLELWPSVAEYFVYDEVLYHAMTHDKRRNESYLVALRQAVPGKVVLDIGTGRDAILARLAVQAGARKVYAVELLDESYQHAKATITKLGLTDKITLIKGNIQHITLPEPIDVCVSEIVGAIGGSEGARIIINDAWKFLRPGGTMIPGRSVTEIAAVSLPEALMEAPAFSQLAGHYVEQIFAQRGYRFDLRLCLKGVRRDHLLSTSGVLEDLDFTATEGVEYDRTERLVVTRAGRMDGLLAWLNLHTTPDERIDILDHEHCWIPIFFPVFSPGVMVQPGDSIELSISSRPCENGLNPDYFIEGQLLRQNEVPLHFSYHSYHYAPRYRQTPFYQRLFADNQLPLAAPATTSIKASELRTYLQKQLPGYMVPSSLVVLPALPLTANGKVDRQALPAPAEVAVEATSIVAPRSPEEALLAGIWASVLGRSCISIHDDFFELGGYSLLAARAVTLVNAALKRNIPLRLLFNAPTVASFAAAILNDKKAAPNRDLASDIWLDSSITVRSNPAEQPVYPPQTIFLTGATGFVGAFLLAELLAQTNATIYCLVRAQHAQEARWRIQQAFAEYQIQAANVDHRIVPVVGDLSKPRFGLSKAAFHQLGETIDCIYHAGALVNYLHPYENLKATNVQGTVEVLRLATVGRTSPVHFVSTLAVTIAGSGGNHVYEDDEPLCPHVAMGYDQSKWVADGIMRLARSRGIPVAIYRPGRIGSHSHTGASNRDDFFIRLLGSCLQLGLAPNIPMVENIMPVDFVARAIVHLSQQQQHANKTFHLLNQSSLHWQWLMNLIQEQGYRLRLVSYTEWYQALQNRAGHDPEHPLHTFVKLLPTGDVAERWLANLHHHATTGQWYATLSLADAIYIDSLSNQAFAMHNTLDGLAGTGLVTPAFDALMLKRILAEGERQGMFTGITDTVDMSVARPQQRRIA